MTFKCNKLHISIVFVCSQYLHQDVEGAGAEASGAGEQIVEVNAVSVVLLHHRQLKPGLRPLVVLRDVHVHVGT